MKEQKENEFWEKWGRYVDYVVIDGHAVAVARKFERKEKGGEKHVI